MNRCRQCNVSIDRFHRATLFCRECARQRSRISPYADGRKRQPILSSRRVNGVRLCGFCLTARASKNSRGCDACMLAYQQASRRSGKTEAHTSVARAIMRGEIQRPALFTCTDCSTPAEQYDHRDYAEPMKVEPVCRRCNILRGPALWVDRAEQAKWVAAFAHLSSILLAPTPHPDAIPAAERAAA